MSLCDRCYQPGACCQNLHLFTTDGEPETFWSDGGREGIIEQLREKGLPFEPAHKLGGPWIDDETGRPYEQWAFNCPKLTAEGRCSIYKNRPEICRKYEPASDGLCVHFGGAEGVDLVEGL